MEGETLEAGRELDIRIHDEVIHGYLWKNGDRIYGNYPRYSTDRSAALQVVDRLTEAGLYVAMSRGRQMNWDVRGWSEDNRARFIAHADNLALAICRAALDPSVLEYLRSREGGAVTNP